MYSGAWWLIALLVVGASVVDVRKHRIPNWITLPYMVAGLVAGLVGTGKSGLLWSACGVLVGVIPPVLFWLLKGMGLGDAKLLAAVGAWLGPEQTGWALFWTALAGGVIACGYALWRGYLGNALLGVRELVAHFARGQATRHRRINLDSAGALSMPYAPAIAIGTWLSFYVTK